LQRLETPLSTADFPSPANLPQILLIDDDRDMGEMLAEYLRPEGYFLHLAFAAHEGLDRLKTTGLVLVILDVMLPDRDGFSVLKQVRAISRIPVLMLTTRSSVEDKVKGLESGADDYIPKPFTPIELLARIRTVLRRTQPSRLGPPFVIVDDLILDTGSRTAVCGGRPIECTAAEFDALHTLASSAGEVVTREHLSRMALGRAPYVGDRGVDNLVSSLRKKLGLDAAGMDRLRSIRNTGYVYVRQASRPEEVKR
jgi:two-component system, OmpR family, response regulator CpxR